MRILLALVVVVVFAAMLLFDTTALVRLTGICVTGGCGVRPIWIATAAGGLVLAVVLSPRLSPGLAPAKAKTTRTRNTVPSSPAHGKAAASRKPKQAKPKQAKKPARVRSPAPRTD